MTNSILNLLEKVQSLTLPLRLLIIVLPLPSQLKWTKHLLNFITGGITRVLSQSWPTGKSVLPYQTRAHEAPDVYMYASTLKGHQLYQS